VTSTETQTPPSDRLLTVAQAAELLGTTERFPRRLIAPHPPEGPRNVTFEGPPASLSGPPTAQQPAPPQRLAYSVDEAAGLLGLSRRSIYELLRDGQLGSVKIGSRRLIRHTDLELFLSQLEIAR
jgi:excisionase family DNA binding protein